MEGTVKLRLDVHTALLLLLFTATAGDLEPTFGKCCAYGANWAREAQQCSSFPAPVTGIPSEHQSVCITTAGICCLRYFRDEQCQKGKQAAQVGQDCVTNSMQGGEYFQDCCQGCKLGLFSGSMGMGCSMRFNFGFPWDNAYLQCCSHASPGNPSPDFTDIGSQAVTASNLGSNLYPGLVSVSESDDLCARFPGKLCAHVCVPTPGSYRCQCRAGFTLSIDGKTCVQDAVTDRCHLNNPCAHICQDTGISIECSCNTGFTLALDQRSCKDVDECSSGVHNCVPGEQVCYNQVGSYSCINADGSLSSPGSTQHRTPSVGSSGGLAGDARTVGTQRASGYDISNEVDQGSSGLINFGGALGVQGFPGARPDQSYLDATHTQGRCPPGYNFNLDTMVCDDVDECEVTSGLCGRGAICQNTIGSYTCTQILAADCPPGFAFDSNLQSCLDIDECLDGSNNCNWTTHFCVNTQGAFTCQPKGGPNDCIAGYKYSSHQQTCVDVDECSEELHGCDPEEETCRNTAGAYECDIKCDEGFQFSHALRTCVDMDECVELPCDAGWECHNTAGSYLCHELPRAFCPAGYKPSNGTASGCEDIDECSTGLDDCSVTERCMNTLGSYICRLRRRCSAGYVPDPTTGECKDVDECTAGVASCLPGQICFNTEGAFECRVECQDGFRYDPLDAAVCVDINECLESPCENGEECSNTEGSYICTSITTRRTTTNFTTTTATSPPTSSCSSGFGRNPNSLHCEDIDECRDQVCEPGQHCQNTYGSYVCTCDHGYRRDLRTHLCEDIDECEEGLHGCQVESEQCINIPGSHTCQARPCSPGYNRDPANPRHCTDIDECESSPCGSEEECVNSNGSFRCRRLTPCNPGFRRNEDNKQCEDIDECVEEAPCTQQERCVNTQGSYRCRTLDCTAGYQRDERGHCRDVDECETGEHTCRIPKEECINTQGSYRCKALPDCPQGFTRDAKSLRCVDVDECVEGTHDCHGGERCYNQYGRYICRGSPSSCTKGFRYNTLERRCQDIDECAETVDSCERSTQTCVNSVGSFKCIDHEPTCDFGYRYNEDERACVDIDECREKLDDCEDGQYCVNTLGSYQCQTQGAATQTCHPGFTFNMTARVCMDIDECLDGTHDCSSSEICVNRRGDYVCELRDDNLSTTAYTRDEDDGEDYDVVLAKRPSGSSSKRGRCQEGYRYNRRRRICMDVNECEEGYDFCNKLTEVCVNTVGRYRCNPLIEPSAATATINTSNTFAIPPPPPPPLPPRPQSGPQCPTGTEYDSLSSVCRDVDECATRPCDEEEVCNNTPGSFQCECQVGFSRDESDQKCEDMNECQLGLHSCTETQRCDNTIGSFACIRIAGCGTGYTLNHNTGECDDNDECKLKTHYCDQLGPKYQCVNLKGSFRCRKKSCPSSQMLNHDGICVELTCNSGFKPVNGECEDINECAEGIPCQRNERCINVIGSFNCHPLLNCGAGYKMNEFGTQCIDVDECADGTHQCTGNQECSNRQGGYICQCPTGFRHNSLRQCQDVNECEAYYGSVCASNAVCENTEGSYRCNCKKGFKQSNDGRTCVDVDECAEIPGICHHNCINVWGSHQCTCRAGYNLARDNRTCSDVNECEEYRGRGRLCIGICVNMAGSFKCSCPDGYRLATDGRTCKDINECETGNVCRGENEHCVNTRGGHKCNSITCPNNYVRDTRHKNRCKKVSLYCLEDDEACHRKPLSYSYNFLPLVSNMSLPSLGQVDLFTMRGPLWSSTTVQFELELESSRAPVGVEAATREFFYLKRTSFNQAVISLVKPISGPQEIQLALNMQLYQKGKYGGSAVAKLLVYVSEYDF
ncbi:fibrillin-2-like isoform X3 [Homarus americanus]|uniref:fibrillin-2-like isoform X3 n=1 Tax=Homarus americanus TaxID=6706 RepID=UPI001C4584FF|nr:fibrillin-2-like isoform X3 [Homarus americanus]